MKRFRQLVVVALVLLLTAGCRTHNPMYDLVVCGSFGVPGMRCADLKNGTFSCSLLDTDSQGRTLFTFTSECLITQKTETAVVICQSSNSQEVYFYEDICYYWGNPNEQKNNELKEKNDWGKPLQKDKMSKRSYVITFDLYLQTGSGVDHSKLKSACCQEFHINEDQLLETIFFDRDNYGRSLYWITISKGEQINKYLVIVNQDYEIAKMAAPETLEDLSDLPAFKELCNWGIG